MIIIALIGNNFHLQWLFIHWQYLIAIHILYMIISLHVRKILSSGKIPLEVRNKCTRRMQYCLLKTRTRAFAAITDDIFNSSASFAPLVHYSWMPDQSNHRCAPCRNEHWVFLYTGLRIGLWDRIKVQQRSNLWHIWLIMQRQLGSTLTSALCGQPFRI